MEFRKVAREEAARHTRGTTEWKEFTAQVNSLDISQAVEVSCECATKKKPRTGCLVQTYITSMRSLYGVFEEVYTRHSKDRNTIYVMIREPRAE